MNTIIIPDDLNIDSSQQIKIFDYHNSKEILRQRVILHQNTISFLIDGNKEVVVGNSTLAIDSSSFLIMKAGPCLMTEKFSETKNYRSLLLFFSCETLLKFIQKSEININKPREHKAVYSFRYDEFIIRFVNSLLDISKLSKNFQKRMLEVKFEEIILYLIEMYDTDFLFSLVAQSNNTSQKFIQTIEANLMNKLSLNELAFLCNMSVSTFRREFKKHYAESPIKWIKNKRLEYAHHMLQQEKKSSEIYFEVGYESLSSFIQAYKLKYGITPKRHLKD